VLLASAPERYLGDDDTPFPVRTFLLSEKQKAAGRARGLGVDRRRGLSARPRRL